MQLKRQPSGAFTLQQHAVRTLASLAAPLVLYIASRMLGKVRGHVLHCSASYPMFDHLDEASMLHPAQVLQHMGTPQ